jgi:cytoskeletal protein CcmA (bactofilin family)
MALFKKAAGPGPSARTQASSNILVFTPPRVVDGIFPPTSQTAITPATGRTYLDSGSKVKGKLNFDGPVRIDGEIEGEINSTDSVAIGESALVSADIKAVSIVVAGAVSGKLSASQRIEIYSSAKVLQGSLTAPEMVIGEEATIEGTQITQPTVTGASRKLRTSRKEESLVADPERKEHVRRL